MPSASSTVSPSQPTTGTHADLNVTGTGACAGFAVINYGYCEPLLLLAATSDTDFSDWILSEDDPAFQTSRLSLSEIALTGPIVNAPTSLRPGDWSVGLGVRNTSDLAGEEPWLDVLCYRSISVPRGTQHVEMRAHFEQHCSIEVLLDDIPVAVPCTDETFYWLADSGRDRIETQDYPGQTVVTISVISSDDPELVEIATVDSADPACIDHRLIGPILRGLSDGYVPKSSNPADLVGRLIVLDVNAECAIILDRDGLTWDPIWPAGYAVSEHGILGPDRKVVADNGALVGLTGRDITGDVRACLVGTGFRVDGVAFVEPLPGD